MHWLTLETQDIYYRAIIMTNPSPPTSTPRLDNLAIRHHALKLLDDSDSMPSSQNDTVKLDKVLKHLGYGYFEFDSTNDTSMENIKGAVIHNDKKIFLNYSLSPQEKNFALAHEIGHIILHGKEDSIDFLKNELPEIPITEIEANVFAYELLMPNHFFKMNLTRLSNDTKKVAEFYCLSEKRTTKRIKFLERMNIILNQRKLVGHPLSLAD